jgi:protein O-GlcNAc transferase
MAIAAFEKVLALHPIHSDARFARCMAELRLIYDDEAEITRCRTAYSAQLDNLIANTKGLKVPEGLPFYLAYQGYNDRDLQGRLGDLMCQLMARSNPPPDRLATPPAAGEPIRVGIVSGFFRLHSVWNIPVKRSIVPTGSLPRACRLRMQRAARSGELNM